MTVFIVALVLLTVPSFCPGLVPWMDTLRTEHPAILGVTALVSGVLSCTYLVSGCWSWLARKREVRKLAKEKQKNEKALHDRLAALTLTEKHFLQEFIEGDSRTIQCNASLSRLDALCDAHVLRMTQLLGVKGTYMISEEAWAYLKDHRDLVATPDHPRPTRDFYSEY